MEGEDDQTNHRRCYISIFCSRSGLFIVMTIYTLFGALLFKTLEGGDVEDVPMHIQRSREDCLRELWLITERLNVLYEKNWTKLVTEQLKRFERVVIESNKINDLSDPSLSTSSHWTFGGAFLYTLTLLTTVGYGRLSPRTALGKVVAIIYALIGVPLMLILLSTLGTTLASILKKIYMKVCCKSNNSTRSPSVGYHKAPSSPSVKFYSRNIEDTASIQIHSSHHNTPNHQCKFNYYDDVPKRATVRAVHTRGRCRRQSQMLTDTQICPATHSTHGTPSKKSMNQFSDIDDTDDADDHDHGNCSHDTPSRIPLIWRPPENNLHELSSLSSSISMTRPTVPVLFVVVLFFCYICAGAVLFVSINNWNFLDSIYFCFLALSTIGIGGGGGGGGDRLPQTNDLHAQLQLLSCCLYLFIGLVLVAMCFSLIHDELTTKCKHIAQNFGLFKH